MSESIMVFPELPELGLIQDYHIVAHQHERFTYRLECDLGHVIVKECASEAEGEKHSLLHGLGVPVPEILFLRDKWIVMQDLAKEPWRLATEKDLSDCDVADALAHWYLQFHKLGSAYLRTQERLSTLHCEMDFLLPEHLDRITERFKLTRHRKWKAVQHIIPNLLRWVHEQPQTLNYNDFYYTNFALNSENSLQAMVFDYDQLGYGIAASDVLNVCSSLSTQAQLAFKLTYGEVSDTQLSVVRPLSEIYSLVMMLDRPRLPEWATATVQAITSGSLLEEMTKAALLVF